MSDVELDHVGERGDGTDIAGGQTVPSRNLEPQGMGELSRLPKGAQEQRLLARSGRAVVARVKLDLIGPRFAGDAHLLEARLDEHTDAGAELRSSRAETAERGAAVGQVETTFRGALFTPLRHQGHRMGRD